MTCLARGRMPWPTPCCNSSPDPGRGAGIVSLNPGLLWMALDFAKDRQPAFNITS